MIELTESLIEGSSRPPAFNDATKGEDIVRDLYVFSDDISKVKISVQTGIYLRLLVETLKMTPYVTAQVLITTSAFVCLSWTGDLLEHASFELYNFLTLMFFISMTFSSMDKISIELSNAFGANNYKRCSEVLFMGILTLFIEAAIVTFPTFFWSEELLVAIGIDPVIAKTVKVPLRWSLISVVLQMCVEVIQTFCMAQGLEHYFGRIGVLSLALAMPANYITICVYDMGIMGFVISRTLVEVIRLLLCLYVARLTHPDTRKMCSLDDITKDLSDFFFESIKFTLGAYGEFVGFEICGYMIALTKDNSQLAAYYSVQNFTGISYTIGVAASVICRTRINILIGMNKNDTAKNFYKSFSLFTIAFGCICGVLTLIFSSTLTSLYAGSNENLIYWIHSLFFIYAFVLFTDTTFTTNAVGMKTIGEINLLLRFVIIFILISNTIGGSIMLYLHSNALQFYALTMLLITISNLLSMRITFKRDWSLIPKRDDNDNRNSIVSMLERQIPAQFNAPDVQLTRSHNKD